MKDINMKFVMFKYIGVIRSLFYKFWFKYIGIGGYFAKPLLLIGTNKISLGNKVRIMPGLRIEALNDGKIIIGNDVSIAQDAHIISGGGCLEIGDRTTISSNVFISNVDHQYEEIDAHILKQDLIFQQTIIGENCFIGHGAVIMAGVNLGKQCIVGANAVVRKGTYPDYCVLAGVPAKRIKQYDSIEKKWKRVNDI